MVQGEWPSLRIRPPRFSRLDHGANRARLGEWEKQKNLLFHQPASIIMQWRGVGQNKSPMSLCMPTAQRLTKSSEILEEAGRQCSGDQIKAKLSPPFHYPPPPTGQDPEVPSVCQAWSCCCGWARWWESGPSDPCLTPIYDPRKIQVYTWEFIQG